MQSYLELISLYKDLLARKREELRLDKERLENGVTKIAQASAQVSHMHQTLYYKRQVHKAQWQHNYLCCTVVFGQMFSLCNLQTV